MISKPFQQLISGRGKDKGEAWSQCYMTHAIKYWGSAKLCLEAREEGHSTYKCDFAWLQWADLLLEAKSG